MFWFYIWLAVAVVALGVSLFVRGYYEEKDNELPSFDPPEFFLICMACLGWPLLLTLLVTCGPFVLLYFWGSRKGERKKQKILLAKAEAKKAEEAQRKLDRAKADLAAAQERTSVTIKQINEDIKVAVKAKGRSKK